MIGITGAIVALAGIYAVYKLIISPGSISDFNFFAASRSDTSNCASLPRICNYGTQCSLDGNWCYCRNAWPKKLTTLQVKQKLQECTSASTKLPTSTPTQLTPAPIHRDSLCVDDDTVQCKCDNLRQKCRGNIPQGIGDHNCEYILYTAESADCTCGHTTYQTQFVLGNYYVNTYWDNECA